MGNSYFKIPALWEQCARRLKGQRAMSAFDFSIAMQQGILQEQTFHHMLTLERRRAERSRKPFVLMALEAGVSVGAETGDRLLSLVTSVILKFTRETDLVGWYKKRVLLGVIFTEISLEYATPITETLRTKIVSALQNELSSKVISKLVVTVHLPEDQDRDGARSGAIAGLHLHGRRSKEVPSSGY
jgi:hypothetical protein